MLIDREAERVASEILGVEELAKGNEWLTIEGWSKTEEGLLFCKFQLDLGEECVAFRLTYPDAFPALPPYVKPEDPDLHLSGQHQWGPGGELCLQYRPDRWKPEWTSVQVLQSAHDLLSGQGTTEMDMVLPSAYDDALDLLGAKGRFVLPDNSRKAIHQRIASSISYADFTCEWQEDVCVVRLASIESSSTSIAPTDGRGATASQSKRFGGLVVRLPSIVKIADMSAEDLQSFVSLRFGHKERIIWSGDFQFVVVTNGKSDRLFRIDSIEEDIKIGEYITIRPPKPADRRGSRSSLTGKSVCIIGCGSLGSKVAASLAREGVGSFALFDPDVLWSDNLVRNELDERHVGHHKAQALAERLRELSRSVTVAGHKFGLTSQTPVAFMASLRELVANSDVIVDATVEPEVFNVLATLTTESTKPLIWGRIYAGGIGGMIARSLPDIDPPPRHAAAQIEKWCALQDKPVPEGPARNYGIEGDDGPLVASDVNVSIIATHMAQHIVDALSQKENRVHADPVYFIGMRRGWIFDSAFDVHPVVYTSEAEWGLAGRSPNREALAFIREKMGVGDGPDIADNAEAA